MADVGELVVKVAMDNSSFDDGIKNLNRSMKVIQSEFKNATNGLKEHGKGLEGLKTKQEMLSKSINIQSEIVQKYKDKLKESKKNLSENVDSQIKLKEKIENTKKAYDETKKVLGENNSKTKELKESYVKLSEEYTKNEEKLRSNVRTIDNYSLKVNNAESKLKDMQQQLNSINKSIDQQGNKWSQLSGKLKSVTTQFENLNKKMSSIGKGLITKITGPIAAIGGIASKIGMDFEASISNVSALSGATGNDLKQLENKAREMGASTSKSAKDAANAMGFLALSGMKQKEMLEAIEPVLRLSEAGNMDLAKASSLTTDSMSTLGVATKDLPYYLDIVAQSARNSNTDIDQMMQSYISCGGVMKTLQVPLKESALYIDMLANKGIKGSESGTALNAVITNLTAPLGRAKDKMEELGLTAFENDGKFKGLTTVFMELKSKTDSMTDAEKNATLAAIGGKEHVKDLSAILGGLSTDYDKVKNAIDNSNGALNEMAKTMQDNNKGSITQLKSALEEVGLKIYDVLRPGIAKVVMLLQNFTNKLNNLSPATQELIIKIAGIVAALGPTLLIGAKLSSGIGKIIGSVTTFSKAISTGSTIAKAAMLALGGPATLITAAIMGIVAAGIALYLNWDKIKSKAESLKKAIHEKWTSIKEGTINIWNGIKNYLSNIWDSIKNICSNSWNSIKESIVNIWIGIKEFFISLWNGIKEVFKVSLENITSFILSKFGFVIDGIKNIWNGIKEYFKGIWEIIKNIFLGTLLIILDIVTGNFTKLKTDIHQIMNNIKEGLQHIWNGIKQIFISHLNILRDIVTKTWTTIKNITLKSWESIKNLLSELWNKIKTLCSNSWNDIKNTTINIWNGLLNWFATLPSRLYDLAINMFTSMKNGVLNTKESIINSAKDIGRSIINAFLELPSKMHEVGKNIVEGLVNGIKNFASSAWEAASGLADGLANKVRGALDIHSPSRVMVEIGKFIVEGLAVGIETNKSLVEKQATNLGNAVIEKVKIPFERFKFYMGNILNWGSTHKDKFEDENKFINNLNLQQVKESKKILDEDYKNRIEKQNSILKNLINNNKKILEDEKKRVNTQINYYDKLYRSSKGKGTKEFYREKISELRAYLKARTDSIKKTEEETKNSIEFTKKALGRYYEEGTELLKKREEQLKEFTSTVNNLAEKLKSALTEKLNSLEKEEEAAIKDSINSLTEWKEETLQVYEETHRARIENLNDEYKILQKNINTELKYLDEKLRLYDKNKADKKDNEKEAELKKILSMNYSAKKKAAAQKELNELIQNRNERHFRESIEQQKEALREQLENKKENIENNKKQLDIQFENDKKNLEKVYNANKEIYDKQLVCVKKFYEEQKKEANLNAKVQKMIIENNQTEILNLLKESGKEYELTGATIADRFATAFVNKLSVVKNAISNITEQLNSINTNVSVKSIPALEGYSDINNTNNTNVKNEYGSILHADKLIVNGHKDAQSFAEELEFYRQQASKSKGGR